MYRLLIKNIGLLQTPEGSYSHKGEQQGQNLKLKDAAIYAENGIIKEIKGVENFKNLQCGAVITCNHFNAFDSFAIQLAYEAADEKNEYGNA